MIHSSKWSLIQCPEDFGIERVGGRKGAALGPEACLRLFSRLKPPLPEPTETLSLDVQSLGEIQDFVKRQGDAAQKLSVLFSSSPVHVVLGGGHDHAYPWIRGYSHGNSKLQIGVLNLDAHFDLRNPSGGQQSSGSPFRQLLEEGFLRPENLVEFGVQSHANSRDLWEYAEKQGVRTVSWPELRRADRVARFQAELSQLLSRVDQVLLSLDLDVCRQADAPGVSAPQAEGLTSEDVIAMVETAGSESRVPGLGIFELSPPLDLAEQTSRLSATVMYHFLAEKLEF
jgi:formimidoylglutamase